MSKIVFVTSLTDNYVNVASRLLGSVKLLRSCDVYVMSLNFDLPSGVGFTSIPVPCDHFPIPFCVQQGQLLDFIPNLQDDDVVVIADADSSVQRDFTADELYWLRNLDGIGMGYNARPGQTALDEIKVCKPIEPQEVIESRLGVGLSDVPIFNAGFVAAKPPVWRQVRREFERLWPLSHELFVDWRCCQLFLCLAVKRLGLSVAEMPYTMHSHQHYGLQPLHAKHEGVLYYGNRPVFFVHHVDGYWHIPENWA